MPRSERQIEQGAAFHVMNRGVARMAIFEQSRDYHFFIRQIEEAAFEYKFSVVAYCLMGNHFHLLLHDRKGQLSLAMRCISRNYAQYFNKRKGRDGPVFKSRFTSKRIFDARQLYATIDYIHENPEKDGFVDNAMKWPWSSLSYYSDKIAAPRWIELAGPTSGLQ